MSEVTDLVIQIQVDVQRMTEALGRMALEAMKATRRMYVVNMLLRTQRCPTCYLPMRPHLQSLRFRCWLCGHTVTDERLMDRSRWELLRDRLTGMEF